MTFSLYNIVSGGMPLYTETQMVPVANGVFNARIRSFVALTLPFDVP